MRGVEIGSASAEIGNRVSVLIWASTVDLEKPQGREVLKKEVTIRRICMTAI